MVHQKLDALRLEFPVSQRFWTLTKTTPTARHKKNARAAVTARAMSTSTAATKKWNTDATTPNNEATRPIANATSASRE